MAQLQNRWEHRLRRAQELQDRYPAAADPLRFYEIVLGFQHDVSRELTQQIRLETALREQLDLSFLTSKSPAILNLAIEHGPGHLREKAQSIHAAGEPALREMLESAIVNDAKLDSSARFLAFAIFQPVAENLQLQLATELNYSKGICPACGGLPLLAILRPEGDGASRWLMCSFCLREWLFRRIICSYCGEEDKEKLPRYSAEECGHVLVEACDTCKRYLKAVNMAVDGRAEPLVDEAALAVLDVWAVEHGYAKIAQNLIGF